MRAVIQRVSEAAVVDDSGQTYAGIGPGVAVLLGVETGDGQGDAAKMADRIAHLRMFGDDKGHLNRSVLDTGGEVLLIPQFTLLGACMKGRRPDFTRAADAGPGRALWKSVAVLLREAGLRVAEGVFQAHTEVRLANDGPVTVIVDTRRQV